MVSRNKPFPRGRGRSHFLRGPGEGPKTGAPPYKVITLNSWEEYLSIISDSPYQNWAFRGQRDASAPLFSALSRYFMAFQVDPRAWPEQEKRILRIFKRKAIHFLQHVPDRDDDFQWLALMQHHGSPTRLWDFTWSPYVAAFFALERATTQGAVWAVNPKKLVSVTERLNKFLEGSLNGAIGIGEPFVMNTRLIAQSGTFVVTRDEGFAIEDIVAAYA